LRIFLTVIEVAVLGVTGWVWGIKPWARGPSIIRLARRVEEGIPEVGHRLVTSIPLSREGSKTPRMFPEPMAVVARESETVARKHRFGRFADYRRLKWAGGLVGVPLLMAAIMLLAYGPELLKILLQRQFLASADIPRYNQLTNNTKVLWPAGDE